MFLKQLHLKNFRNYTELKFKFSSPITVLIGDNAQGKTNFLEAVYFLATSKSTKAERDSELIHDGEEVLHVEGVVELKKDEDTELEIAMQSVEGTTSNRKRVKVNGVARRLNDYVGNLAVVLFQPEDINMVTGSPSLRRYFIDQTLSQVDREYKRSISQYEQIITRKNRILKLIREGLSSVDQLVYWIEQQVTLGELITEKRTELFGFLNSHKQRFGHNTFQYIPSKVSKERLLEYQDREIGSASSLIGPHRDDFLFLQDQKDLSKYGSRGEQRTAVVNLKLAEVEFIETKLNSRPLLLLDDIFSELDNTHRQHIVDLSHLQQTLIATVEFDKFLKDQFMKFQIAEVEKGKIL
jgi:DNA replication and repair protein RecF